MSTGWAGRDGRPGHRDNPSDYNRTGFVDSTAQPH